MSSGTPLHQYRSKITPEFQPQRFCVLPAVYYLSISSIDLTERGTVMACSSINRWEVQSTFFLLFKDHFQATEDESNSQKKGDLGYF